MEIPTLEHPICDVMLLVWDWNEKPGHAIRRKKIVEETKGVGRPKRRKKESLHATTKIAYLLQNHYTSFQVYYLLFFCFTTWVGGCAYDR